MADITTVSGSRPYSSADMSPGVSPSSMAVIGHHGRFAQCNSERRQPSEDLRLCRHSRS